jgi:hypothetical protein
MASPSTFPLLLSDASRLLSADYQPTETGWAVAPDGMMHIAASTYMPSCSGEMIAWWFGWINTTEQYKLWHPFDHVFSAWEGPRNNDSTYIGGAHLVHEYIGGEMCKLKIKFASPEVYFGAGWEERFKAEGYELAVCGRVGNWDGEGKGDEGTVWSGHLIHLIKKEKVGVRMRSRFWLGDVEGVTSKEERERIVPGFMAEGLCRHATEEMAILASVLPGLYEKYSKQ